MNLARCKQINRSINAHCVLTPIRYQQLHIYIHVCVCQCVVYGIHDSPSVHTLVAHATFGACYHKIQRDMSTACGAKKTVVREQNNERRSDAQATQLPKYTPPSTTTTNNSSNNNYSSITFYALSAASSLIYVCLSLHSVVQTLIH